MTNEPLPGKELKLLVPFTQGDARRLTASEIARALSQPQKTVSRKLNSFCAAHLLNYTREGRLKQYYFDLNDGLAAHLLAMVEHGKAIGFSLRNPPIALMLNDIARELPVILFGSHAKGSATEGSDIDLLVLGRKSAKIKKVIGRYPFETVPHYSRLDIFRKQLNEGSALAREIAQNHIIFGYGEGFLQVLVDYFKNRGG